MPDVYQLVAGGNGDTIAATFEGAMRHVDRLLRTRSDRPDDGGSLSQRIRHAARGRFEILTVTRHDTDAEPGTSSARETFDLLDSADPAFAMQSALWDFAEGEESLEEATAALLASYAEALKGDRRFREDDAALVARLRATEAVMGGERLVPSRGMPDAVLERLPGIVADRFAELAARFYPDAASPSPSGPR